ncbi:MAG: metal-dependent hydrolase [Cyclonatronaceae bacterium]
MDSLTQLTFGAAVGEAVLGKKVGNKALLWGAFAGTFPDLDVVFSLFLDPVDYLSVHRGFSHSLFFPFLMAPLLALVAGRVHRRSSEAGFWGWAKLFFWCLLTHPLLDAMTGYGTQLLFPITRYGFEFNTIFIIDPAFTLPLLISVIAVAFYRHDARGRRYWSTIGLSISVGYLLLTIPLKLSAIPHFERALEAQEIEYERIRTFPNPLTSLYWRGLAQTPDGNYVEGHFSHLWKTPEIRFNKIPGRHELLEEYGIADSHAVGELQWFSKGYYSVSRVDEERLMLHDLRFGAYEGWLGSYESFTFNFLIYPHGIRDAARQELVSGYAPSFRQLPPDIDITGEDLQVYFRSLLEPPHQPGGRENEHAEQLP